MSSNTLPAVARGGQKPSQMLAQQLGGLDPIELANMLRRTVVPGTATNEELYAFCLVAATYKLNPIMREIYAMPKKGGGIQAVVGIDGWLKILNGQASLDGFEFAEHNDADFRPISKTVHIFIKGRTRPVQVTEYLTECYRDTPLWNQMPHRMLRHRVIIQGIRVAFGISGIMDPEDAASMTEPTPSGATTLPPASVSDLNSAIDAPAPVAPVRRPAAAPARREAKADAVEEQQDGGYFEGGQVDYGDGQQLPATEAPAAEAPRLLPQTFPMPRDEFIQFAIHMRPESWEGEDGELAASFFVESQLKLMLAKPWDKSAPAVQKGVYDLFVARKIAWAR